jgi:hypothetical protein
LTTPIPVNPVGSVEDASVDVNPAKEINMSLGTVVVIVAVGVLLEPVPTPGTPAPGSYGTDVFAPCNPNAPTAAATALGVKTIEIVATTVAAATAHHSSIETTVAPASRFRNAQVNAGVLVTVLTLVVLEAMMM